MNLDDEQRWQLEDFLNEFIYKKENKPLIIGVDWAVGCGMTRGEVISREDNVVSVRFKTENFDD